MHFEIIGESDSWIRPKFQSRIEWKFYPALEITLYSNAVLLGTGFPMHA
jgi:hypothetical protein